MPSTATNKRPTLTRRMARQPEAVQLLTAATSAAPPQANKRQTKAALVVEMLVRDGGLSLEELCHATAWQAHTSRAFLTGLRKKGRVISRSKREDGTTFYRIADPAGVPTEQNAGADA
jgi:hypothetical protein